MEKRVLGNYPNFCTYCCKIDAQPIYLEDALKVISEILILLNSSLLAKPCEIAWQRTVFIWGMEA